MSAIVFSSSLPDPGGTSIAFEVNPSLPARPARIDPLLVPLELLDGSVRVFDCGRTATLDLTWTEANPMVADDYHLEPTDNLVEFVRAVRGGAEAWTYTDETGAQWQVRFRSVPRFRRRDDGFVGTVSLFVERSIA